MQFNHGTIKKLAKEIKVRSTDLIALASGNDPFYCGTKSDYELAEWFAELWRRFGYGRGVHLRRVHYRIISQDPPVNFPNGMLYENTVNCWAALIRASKAARYLGMVDPLLFDDRRNPGLMYYPEGPEYEPDPEIYVENAYLDFAAFQLPAFPLLPKYEVDGFEGKQNYNVEIWCEKSTMNDVLIPLCQRYGVGLVVGTGEISITQVANMVENRIEKPARILYISDFDPAGECMPVSISRKIEYFLSQRKRKHDVKLFPVVLTLEQVKEYRLPRTPIKDTERRKNDFENRYGEGATELDALEALYPGKLAEILKGWVTRYIDPDLEENVSFAEWNLRDYLSEIRMEILNSYKEKINEIEKDYKDLNDRIKADGQELKERMQTLWQAIRNELDEQMPEIDVGNIPTARPASEADGLFDSSRDYITQLENYKKFKGNGNKS